MATKKKGKNVKKKSNMKDKWRRGAKAGSFDDDFYKLKSGANYIRLAQDDFTHVYEHWYDDTEGSRKRTNCVAPPDKRGNSKSICPLCAAADSGIDVDTQHKYFFNIYVGTLKKVKGKKYIVYNKEVLPLKVGPKVGSSICEYAAEILEDEEGEWEGFGIKSISELNLKIVKTGSGLGTEYAVKHLSNVKSKFVGEQTELYDLDNYSAPGDIETIKKNLGEDFDDEEDEDFEDEDFEDEDEVVSRKKSKKSKNKKKSKKRSKKLFEDDDFDEEDDDDEDFDWDDE